MSCPKLERAAHAGVAGPVVVAIMDGVGVGRGDEADAVKRARTPTLDRLYKEGLFTTLSAHGHAVGMPSEDDMGNSEVGHNALGAGRVFDQGAKLVAEAIADGRIFAGTAWRNVIGNCLSKKTPLHFIGLLSDGNVHSHIDHLIALVRRADHEGVATVRVHALLDGRDVPKTSALTYIALLEAELRLLTAKPGRDYAIASGGGRMGITMDRYESDWPMVGRGWRTHVLGDARPFPSAKLAVETLRAENPGIIDQDLPAFVVTRHDKPIGRIEDRHSVILFNFRGDRMLELVRAFEDERFDRFPRGARPNVTIAGMTLYDGDTKRPKQFLVPPPEIRCTFGELLSQAGVAQLAVSETQKFGHVTYFWNGNRTGAFDEKLERYIEIPSHPPPFAARPEMRAPEIAKAVADELDTRAYGLVRVNFANGDMVGHTGDFSATVKAMEAVDAAVATLVDAVMKRGGALVLTADHGNAEDMAERDKKSGAILRDEHGAFIPKTSHSLNPVPFVIVLGPADRDRFALANIKGAGLGNVAATAAYIMGLVPPASYLPSLVCSASK
jgi:2,3-bisphosphoglycerate-independent phosphoglycerate mutase